MCFCESCQQAEAVRCEEVTETAEVFFVQAAKGVIKKQGRCDFCDRLVTHWLSNRVVPVSNWHPTQGLLALAGMLGVDFEQVRTPRETDIRLRSLLSSVQRESCLKRSTFLGGAVVGSALGAILGGYGYYLLFVMGSDADQALSDGPIIWGFLLAITGALFGGVLNYWIASRTIAHNAIRRALEDYSLNLSELAIAAQSYSPRIRAAIQRCRDQASIKSSKT